jgi:hypothetical protein
MPQHRLSLRRRAEEWIRADLAEMRKVPDNVRTMRRHPLILVRGVAVTVLVMILVSLILSLIGRPEWFAPACLLVAVPAGSAAMGRAVLTRRSPVD